MRAKAEAPPSASEPTITEDIYYYEGHKYPRYVNIPPELIDVTGKDGVRRATFLEYRVRNILRRQSDTIEGVTRNETHSKEDSIGHDLTVILKGNSPIKVVHVQVKASRDEVVAYKASIIKNNKFSKAGNTEELVRKWLTEHGIILLNGTDGKSEVEILEIFYLQLERIKTRNQELRQQLGGLLKEYHHSKTMLNSQAEPIQIFPGAL